MLGPRNPLGVEQSTPLQIPTKPDPPNPSLTGIQQIQKPMNVEAAALNCQYFDSVNQKLSEEDKPYKCKFCTAAFIKRTPLNRHEKTHTVKEMREGVVPPVTNPLSCNFRSVVFPDLSTIVGHARLHAGAKPFTCNFCDARVILQQNLVGHLRSHVGQTQTGGENTTVSITNTSTFSDRNCSNVPSIQTVRPLEENKVKQNAINTPTISQQQRANRNETEKNLCKVKPFKCQFCERSFSRKDNQARHERIHTGEKPFTCQYCYVSFSQRQHLIGHERIHTGEKPFKCKFCETKFSNAGNRLRHERIHTGEKPFACCYCDARFTQKTRLINHIRSHTGEKPFACGVCGVKFSLKHHLIAHERVHSGQLFACSHCKAKFNQLSDLKRHERMHTGEKPFACTFCDAKFAFKNLVKRHEQMHSRLLHYGEKRFVCEFCGVIFARKNSLVQHERMHDHEDPFVKEDQLALWA